MASVVSATDAVTSSLGLGHATTLAHALCGAIGDRHDIRVLSIKGPFAEYHGLRPARTAADADVLVAPSDFDAFCVAIEAAGWKERVARETPTLIAAHSRTYIHESWPCDIDVHLWFPGFFADPSVVFDELWKRRRAIPIGEVTVLFPGRPGAAAIAAMHALRNMTVVRHRAEWAWVRDALRDDFSETDRRDFLDLVTKGRAQWVLRDQLRDITGVEPENDLTAEEQRAWQAHRAFAADGGAASWWIALRRQPFSEWPAFLLRAAWVPRAEIPRNDASVLPSRGQAWSYQVARWGRGFTATLRYVRGADR